MEESRETFSVKHEVSFSRASSSHHATVYMRLMSHAFWFSDTEEKIGKSPLVLRTGTIQYLLRVAQKRVVGLVSGSPEMGWICQCPNS